MKTLQLSLVFCISYFSLFAQQIKEKVNIPQEVKTHMQDRVDVGVNVGIVAALIDGDEVDYFSVGTTDLKGKTAVDSSSVFEIGSISKTFTGILVADQILNGSMSLSDPIQKFLPESVTEPTRNGKEITIKDVLTHSSGLPRMPDNFNPTDPSNPYKDYTEDLLFEFLSNHVLSRDIGSSYEYSNLAMGLMGHILALHTGKSFEELMIEKIANPLHMEDTRITFTPQMKAHLAYGHSSGELVSNWDLGTLAGAGGIRSTAKDLVNYIKANLGVIETSINRAMNSSQEVLFENGDTDIAMAWQVYTSDNNTYVMHSGGTGGYNTFIAFLKGTQKGVVVLSNATVDVSAIGMRMLNPEVPLSKPKTPISMVIRDEMNSGNLESAIAKVRKLHSTTPLEYDFKESSINSLAYKYLRNDEKDLALELFKLNVELHPEESNPYDSLGEAYLSVSDTVNSIANYKKSLELNPGNTNAIDYLNTLGVDTSSMVKDVQLSNDVLETYIGKYQLAPNFILTVTLEDGQLMTQATGQSKVEVYPSAKDNFYLKVVDAKLRFNRSDDGVVESVTLFQNGNEMEAKRMKH